MVVKDYIAFHLSMFDYDLGIQWPPINREYENENRKRAEEITERIRDVSTVLNSRASSLFVCSTIDNVKLWAIKKFKGLYPYLYTLKLSGELLWVDATSYEKVFTCMDNGDGNIRKIEEDAISYWREVNPNDDYPILVEGLFKGEALIVGKRLYSI